MYLCIGELIFFLHYVGQLVVLWSLNKAMFNIFFLDFVDFAVFIAPVLARCRLKDCDMELYSMVNSN